MKQKLRLMKTQPRQRMWILSAIQNRNRIIKRKRKRRRRRASFTIQWLALQFVVVERLIRRVVVAVSSLAIELQRSVVPQSAATRDQAYHHSLPLTDLAPLMCLARSSCPSHWPALAYSIPYPVYAALPDSSPTSPLKCLRPFH